MKTPRVLCAALTAGVVVLAGCSQRANLPVYNPSQTGVAMHVETGEVVSVRDVLIKPDGPSATSTGSILGAGAGRSAVTGNPGPLGGAVGSVVGASVGSRLDEKAGEEITIAVEGGLTIVVVQERSSPPLAPGERVKIVSGSSPSMGRYPGGGGGWGGIIPGSGIMGGSSGGNTRVLRDPFSPPATTRHGQLAETN